MVKKQFISTLGLIIITFLASIQYVFLASVPEEVSTFSFLFITNIIGLLVLGITHIKHLKDISARTVKKAAFLALINTVMNFFVVLGSRNMDSVIIASVMSMYFIFITPILIIMRKKINFFSGIASIVAVIALILMFEADIESLFSSLNVIYLLIADVFFAIYVIGISTLGEDEDSNQLAMSQMFVSAIIAIIGWTFEMVSGKASFAFPTDGKFWISAVFIGVFIRAIYGIVQISCQKYVPAMNASLIFSSEIIMTLMFAPIVSSLMHTEYSRATIFQVIGCILFILAILIVDESFMQKLGYSHMGAESYVDDEGNKHEYTSISKKIIYITISFCMVVLVLTTIICLFAIFTVRKTAVSNSTSLGNDAAQLSEDALKNELEIELKTTAIDKANLAQEKLRAYQAAVLYAASYAESLLDNPDAYDDREVEYPLPENGGIWTMQRTLASEEISYKDDLYEENLLFGNMEDVFRPIVENNENISTIYMGIEQGLLVSYDTYSDLASSGGEVYYEFRNSEWYLLAKETGICTFTKTYQDAAGRGLTVTCEAPFYDSKGKFAGCIAVDILVKDLNDSMINDGISDPVYAELINESGDIIASRSVDPYSERVISVYDEDAKSYVSGVADEVLLEKEGISKTGGDQDARYIAYSTIGSTEWTICISCPVAYIIAPAISIHNNIGENTEQVIESVLKSIAVVIQMCLILIALVLLSITFSVGRFVTKIVNPINQLKDDVQEISGGNLERQSEVNTNDEIGMLANSFNKMTYSLKNYITSLTEATVREERIASELNLATQIQASSLPTEFPNTDSYQIYATMTPAKEVGGDFYDFFRIDDSHIGVVMADVSGKGVPAALFMMNSKTLIKNQCQHELSPAKVLEMVNQQICENNKAEMFVTVWLGILDLKTGIMTCANAGHEYPVFKPNDGSFELFKDHHGLVIGAMEGIKYKEYELMFNEGDQLFVYTDGLVEATNAENELFGSERMLESLNANEDKNLEQILRCMKDDIDQFVNGAPQFDDLTMLCLEFKKTI